ncbi:MAG: alpha/beta fold hydrolase [Gemmatimonadetes bacterium]|nr:alpha/beta fold hydrolase [Gemmatimonadota bacterium]
MRFSARMASATAIIGALFLAPTSVVVAQHTPTIKQWLAPGYPQFMVAAKKADRIAWQVYDEGKRNVYFAAAPDFRARRLTSFLEDDGVELTNVTISDDGSVVAFVRGLAPNRDGWVANPTANPDGAERAIWAIRTAGGAARRVAEGSSPVLSPDGRHVLFLKDGQIYRASTTQTAQSSKMDKGEEPFIKAWGSQSNASWSPDGTKISFVSNRNDHSYIAIYDVAKRTVRYMAPDVDFDSSPTWSGDAKQVAFLRRPGLSFGQMMANQPGGLAAGGAAVLGGRGGRGGRGGGGGGGGRAENSRPGLFSSAFEDGSTLKIMVGDPATGVSREMWRNTATDLMYTAINGIVWANDAILFQLEPEEWARMYSLKVNTPGAQPIVLTPGEGQMEQTGISPDGKWLFYSTNVGDIDRRHVWKVPTAGGEAVRVTTGEINTFPAPLASGNYVATLSATALRPQSVGIWPTAANSPVSSEKLIYPTLTSDFPMDAQATPTNVTLTAADGMKFNNQLFLPKDLKPGEKRPAIIFVHGGPRRQMLLGYHYLSFYHVFYAVNQWLTSQGYVVLSVNYRSGIGYGKSFRMAPNTGGNGKSEYQDVLAAGKYLQTRDDVDPNRVGIWGLSYGGLLTAEALARNSDVFITGVDLAGVHLQGNSLDTASVSYKSSSISQISKWTSPVLLLHGDDDRNVAFAQTVGLVQLLRANKIYYELMVIPDDVHETLLHSRWLDFFARMEPWLDKYLKKAEKPPIMGAGSP